MGEWGWWKGGGAVDLELGVVGGEEGGEGEVTHYMLWMGRFQGHP